MNSPTVGWSHPVRKQWYRVLLHLLAIVIALRAALPEALKVDAAPAADGVLCSVNNGCPVYAPPELLYLNQSGMYAATQAQAVSLRNLQNQAIANVIEIHGLAANDRDAVQSWGRSEALAALYDLLVQAVNASPRSTNQQNAVDWLTAVAQRQNVQAAEAAAREYVKWAALDLGRFDYLLLSNASKSDLQTFLSGKPLNYNSTNPSLATGGWCVYRSPAPYGDDYKGYNDSTCSGPIAAITLPPTPSYDQFVLWGQAKANYPLLTNLSYLSTAQSVGIGLGIALPLGAIIAGSFPVSLALAELATSANYVKILGEAADVTSILETATTFSVAAGLTLVTTILAAITAAILLGINVTDAANLPSKLATLIDTARTTPPDVSTLVSSSSGGTSVFSIFVGTATPAPLNQTCDNAIFANSSPPGWYPLVQIGSDQVTLTGIAPCLNPTDIPPASAADPQFIVTAKGASSQTAASAITWKDTTSGSTSTARLSGNWFITQTNGATAQSLHIAYTDWDGKEQNAWLLGNPTDGYEFLTYSAPADSSTTVSADTCAAQGYCGDSTAIQYVGADGKQYSATVRGYHPTNGTPIASSAVEAKPVTFKANNFAPTDAVGPISYEWHFYLASSSAPQNFIFDIGSGATANYTWQTGGTYRVDLIATDSRKVQGSTSFQVTVAGVPPTLKSAPACVASPSVPCNTWAGDPGSSLTFRGSVSYAGSKDNLVVKVNWGDGSAEDITSAGGSIISLLGAVKLTPSSTQSLTYDLLGTHTYAAPGIYYPTVTAVNMTDGLTYGGAASQTYQVTIKGAQAITFAPIGGHSYGDVFSISATGGVSGQPVTFAVTSDPPACALSNASSGAGTGSATVTVTGAGFCDITASQAGTASYYPAPSVRQRVFTLLGVLTVTASSATITYGEPVPAITPSYSGFVNGDTTSVLATPATCASASNNGAAGTYATTCAGAAAPNYSANYVPGTLTINKVPLTITANSKTMTYGSAMPSFDAQYSGLVSGETSGVVSGLTCAAKEASGQTVSSTTPVGSYPITCSGGSAANYSLSYVAGTLTIDMARTSTIVSLSSPASVFGQPVIATAKVTVNNPGTGLPTGRVTFTAGGAAIAGCSGLPLDTATGTATCTITALRIGATGINANYGGDNNFIGSSMEWPVFVTVNKASVTTALSASANPSTSGSPATFTATLAAAAPGAGIPTGIVTFKEGATTLGTGTLSTSSGTASAIFTTSGLRTGQHTITASYSGDGNFLAGTGATLTQYVNTNLSSYPKLPSGAYNLSNLNLSGGYFVNAALAGARLNGSNLTNAIFLRANLTNANLNISNLKGANFASATLTGANLSVSNLMGANLTDATLTGANLTISNLMGANLTGATLTGANLSISNLVGANLTGANLKGAIGLKTAALTNIIWNQTICPDGTTSNNNRGTCIGHL